MSAAKWLVVSLALALLVVLVAVVAWGAPQAQVTPKLSTSYAPAPNLPDFVTSGLSTKISVFNADVYALGGGSVKDFDGCICLVKQAGQRRLVWVISPQHRIQTLIQLAATKGIKVRICGRKYNQPPDCQDWEGRQVYLADKIILTLKSL